MTKVSEAYILFSGKFIDSAPRVFSLVTPDDLFNSFERKEEKRLVEKLLGIDEKDEIGLNTQNASEETKNDL